MKINTNQLNKLDDATIYDLMIAVSREIISNRDFPSDDIEFTLIELAEFRKNNQHYSVIYEFDNTFDLFKGTYEQCKAYINEHWSSDQAILNKETGRLMSIVWD
jgi:hypothetical protein